MHKAVSDCQNLIGMGTYHYLSVQQLEAKMKFKEIIKDKLKRKYEFTLKASELSKDVDLQLERATINTDERFQKREGPYKLIEENAWRGTVVRSDEKCNRHGCKKPLRKRER